MNIQIVVAMDESRGIGKDNKLPWSLPEDLAHFKLVTLGQPVIMGRKTWESLPSRPLVDRLNIVVSREKTPTLSPKGYVEGFTGEIWAPTVERAIAIAKASGAGFSSIIGGAQIYDHAIRCELANRMIITHVDGTHECDAVFPWFNSSDWQEIQSFERANFSFATYDNKRNPWQ